MSLYSESHWRNHAAPIIARVIAENAGKDENAIKLALREAYPFGQRKYHPYKVWLDEIQVQLGKKPHAMKRIPVAKVKIQTKTADETVMDLFAEDV